MTGPDSERRPAGSSDEASQRAKPGAAMAFTRFAVVGASGVVVNLAALWLLHQQGGLPFPLASAIATEVAIITNYCGNELWTFHLRRLSLRRLAQFNVAALASLVLTVAVATAAAQLLHPLLAQLAGIAVGSATNFLLNFRWIWRR